MTLKYIQLKPESSPPNISELEPFRSVVVADEPVTPEWQSQVSEWLVKSGCLYMMAWGNKCSTWDDSVDYANMEAFNYETIPDEKFIMTTWHENEPLKEVFWFCKKDAFHPTVELINTLILHISHFNRERELIAEYKNA